MKNRCYALYLMLMRKKAGPLTPSGTKQNGQTIVLFALTFIALLALIGLAVDAGFLFARRSQLSAAVDAAVLAGVTELDQAGVAGANIRARQFLSANNLPEVAIASLRGSADTDILGARKYTITVTWPVDLYFLPLLGFESLDLTDSASAAYFPLVDIYSSRRVEEGIVGTSNQAIFGPQICTRFGDPFSPWNSQFAPGAYSYKYRILIPPDYPSDIVRVEIYDPDSINQDPNAHTIEHSATALAHAPPHGSYTGLNASGTCGTRKNTCLLKTGEQELTSAPYNLDLDQVNLWWFVRIDENRGVGSTGHGNGQCGEPGSYTARFNTQTLYELSYFRRNPNGVVERAPLAAYTGQVGDGIRDTGDHLTDMRWVAPGGRPIFDQPVPVPTDCGSLTGGYSMPGAQNEGIDTGRCAGAPYSPPGPGRGFEISISQHLENILTDPANGNRFIYIDVTAISGASENGYELWAGPPDYTEHVSGNVNVRNIQALNSPGIHSSRGVTIFGMGFLPMNSNYNSWVDIPLLYIGPEFAGETIYVSMFDPDAGARPPIIFYFDSIGFKPLNTAPYRSPDTDWQLTFGAGTTDPEGRCWRNPAGYTTQCDDQWVSPAFNVTVPQLTEACTNPDDPNQQNVCTPFYGGRLIARYRAGQNDSYAWSITMSSLPYLDR
jgi:hypothetical protein